MENQNKQTDKKTVEVITISVGLILTGLAIAITGVSYLLNMTFTYQWLVWIIGIAFVIVGLITIIWPLGFRAPGETVPEGKFRFYLILSIPLAFIVSSQVCGLGLSACNTLCHLTNIALIILAIFTAIRIHRAQTIGGLLIPMVIIALIPHCVCFAPINTIWHSIFGGVAPTCEMMPLAASFFSIMALRGIRPQLSTLLVVIIFVVMVFIIIGGLLFGFPWQGCVNHPRMP
jgi:hypothetical protein